MKIYINRNPIIGPWGGGNAFVNAFHNYVQSFGHQLVAPTETNTAPDAILLAGLDNDGVGISVEQAIMYKSMMENVGHKVKLIIRINENDARKATSGLDEKLVNVMKHMDGVVFVSHWLKDYFEKKGRKNSFDTVIINGVDKDIFQPQEKLNNGKINLLMSHWSDNYLKGQDYAECLDEFVGKHCNDFTFTYIGRTKAKFKNSTLVNPLFGFSLATEISKYDVCINATRFDPGPNSVIEPISCGLPTYVHCDGGGAVEFAGYDHVFSSKDELECLLLKKQFLPNKVNFNPWMMCIQQYVKYIENVCGKFTV